MKHCKECNVDVYEHHSNCPLCHTYLGSKEHSDYEFIEYKNKDLSRFLKYKYYSKLSVYLIIFISIGLNILSFRLFPYFWSPIVSTGAIYLYYIVFDTFNSKRRVGRRIINHYIVLSLFCITIDLSLGFDGFSFEFLLPLISIGFSILSLLNLLVYEKEYQDSITYILAMIIFNVLPIILWLILGLDVIWPSIASLTFSVLTVLFMIIFTYQQFKLEIKKRIHF